MKSAGRAGGKEEKEKRERNFSRWDNDVSFLLIKRCSLLAAFFLPLMHHRAKGWERGAHGLWGS
jgi:hypothetical protein